MLFFVCDQGRISTEPVLGGGSVFDGGGGEAVAPEEGAEVLPPRHLQVAGGSLPKRSTGASSAKCRRERGRVGAAGSRLRESEARAELAGAAKPAAAVL